MKRVTQREVAARAGVSRATVSYVLGDSDKSRVPISSATRRRVLEAASSLGYQPDVNAQNLRWGKSKVVGVLLPDMKNPHFWQILSGIEREAHRSGYTLLIFHSALVKSEEDVGLRELASRRIDGLILISSFPPSWRESTRGLSDSRMPVVDLSNVDSPFDRVVANYRDGTRQVMDHLFGLGHRRIGFLYGVASPEVGLDRLVPYREALASRGLPEEHDLVVTCGTTLEQGYRAAAQLLSLPEPPTAIIAINDFLAIATVRAATDRGLAIPSDLSLVGFDDIPFARFLTPSLTTVRRETEQVGEKALRLLLERMANPLLPQRVEEVGSQLVPRESTGIAPKIARAIAGK